MSKWKYKIEGKQESNSLLDIHFLMIGYNHNTKLKFQNLHIDDELGDLK